MKPTRMKLLVAASLSMLLMAPTGAALASANESAVATRPEHSRSQKSPGHPTVTIDRVYRGSADGVLGTHVWTGDVFGTGVETTVSYSVAVDAAGVPVVTSIVVDESTLPEGVTYSVREGSVATRAKDADGDHEKDSADGAADEHGDDAEQGDGAESASVVNVDMKDASTDELIVADAAAEETEPDEMASTRYFGRAGVRFAMGDRWAGLLILLNGAVGAEDVAYLKTILVSPPANGLRDETDVPADTDKSRDGSEKPKSRDEEVRHDHESRDHGKDSDRGGDDQRDGDRGHRGGSHRGGSDGSGGEGRRGNG